MGTLGGERMKGGGERDWHVVNNIDETRIQ